MCMCAACTYVREFGRKKEELKNPQVKEVSWRNQTRTRRSGRCKKRTGIGELGKPAGCEERVAGLAQKG